MIKKFVILSMCLFVFSFVYAQSDETTSETPTRVGGHFKFLYNDSISGKRTTHLQGGAYDSSTTGGTVGAYPNWIVLFFSHKINDWLAVEFSPSIEAASKATPAYGTNIGEGITRNQRASYSLANYKPDYSPARILVQLPDDYSLVLGNLYGKISWEYGDMLSWEDQLHLSKFSCSAAEIHDNGIEVQKTYEINGITVPFTFQVGNGSNSYTPDADQQFCWLTRIEPELFGLKWELSYFNSSVVNPLDSKSNPDIRYGLGVQYAHGPLSIRSEFMQMNQADGRNIQNPEASKAAATALAGRLGTDNLNKGGFNVVSRYILNPLITLTAAYYEYYSNGGLKNNLVFNKDDALEKNRDVYLGIVFNIADGATILVNYDMGYWTRKDNAVPATISGTGFAYEKLEFNRLSIGTRITF